MYLVTQIKKGVIDDFLLFALYINSPVIFGGRDANPKEFPHMGAVGWRARNETQKWIYKCGSTLISDKFLLIAAHCSKLPLNKNKDVVSSFPEVVVLGLENLERDAFNIHGDGLEQLIERIIVHPLYAPPKKYHDIALIEMKTAVAFVPHIQTACLWSRQDTVTQGANVTITGWGTTESVYGYGLIIDDDDLPTMMKYQLGRVVTKLCHLGDSGGPLQVQIPTETEGKMYRIIGITSFGIKCGARNKPEIYTRVSTYIDWIEDNVWRSHVSVNSNL